MPSPEGYPTSITITINAASWGGLRSWIFDVWDDAISGCTLGDAMSGFHDWSSLDPTAEFVISDSGSFTNFVEVAVGIDTVAQTFSLGGIIDEAGDFSAVTIEDISATVVWPPAPSPLSRTKPRRRRSATFRRQ